MSKYWFCYSKKTRGQMTPAVCYRAYAVKAAAKINTPYGIEQPVAKKCRFAVGWAVFNPVRGIVKVGPGKIILEPGLWPADFGQSPQIFGSAKC